MEKREEDQTSSVGDLLRDIETALDTVLDEREKQLQQQVLSINIIVVVTVVIIIMISAIIIIIIIILIFITITTIFIFIIVTISRVSNRDKEWSRWVALKYCHTHRENRSCHPLADCTYVHTFLFM